ncbi:Maltase 2 [Nymphon striatum]|nr:Maltase 2 [Nymphon striatum]
MFFIVQEVSSFCKISFIFFQIQFSNSNHDSIADGKKGDAAITIQDLKVQFSGMNKEELMKYVNDPFWIRLRWVLFVLFWVLWVAMIVGAAIIIVLAPRCAAPPELEWWQKGVIYNVNTRSFKDSNGDGSGDLQGIIEKLDYIQDIGTNTLLLSAIFEFANEGFGVTNYTGIDKLYGNLAVFDELMEKIESNDLHVILDFEPNHSSDKHSWFLKSSDPNHEEYLKYKDFYIWGDSPKDILPNNWLNVYSEPAWTWHDGRKQYYLHQFLPSQPDLNFRNPDVKAEILNALKFWLEKGVHGFRMKAVSHIFENENLKDEVAADDASDVDKNSYNYWNHKQTTLQPELFELLSEWKNLLNEYESPSNKRILMSESNDPSEMLIKYYRNENTTLVNLPLNMELLKLKSDVSGKDLHEIIQSYYNMTKSDSNWPSWQIGNGETDRVGTRLGQGMIDLMNILGIFLKGTAVTYYGEEIGMTNTPMTVDQIVDPAANYIGKIKNNQAKLSLSRDGSKTPMQWNSSENVGFSTARKTWLPININKESVNVKDENDNKKSHLSLYKQLVKLRNEPTFLYGVVEFPIVNELIFSALRYHKGVPGYLLVMNVGDNSTTVDFTNKPRLPSTGLVHLSSYNLVDKDLATNGKRVSLSDISLDPKQAVMLTFIPKME